jgi:acetyl esterase/lipase
VFPAQLADVKAAVRYLRGNAHALGLETTRVGVWGESAGGHLAALLGTSGGVEELDDPGLGDAAVSSRVQAVVDWFGPSSFSTFDRQLAEDHCSKRIAGADSVESRLVGAALSSRPDLAHLASPITHVTSEHPPFLIEHGKDDCLVPWQQSEELAGALNAGRSKATLVLFEHARHGGVEFVDAANLARVVAFFDTHLR